ncbi:MAG TPA: type VI secretion system ImpA family N-terminal domain-containing protein [Acidobacteriaceae bacterium]|nr:type VI secretion system ImpA family N-terminal domain-containing protein [Acidobacteriaceae bacterium]
MDRVVDECVLVPLPGLKPSGDDLRAQREWVALRAARPRPADDLGQWTPATSVKTDWATYRDMVEGALCTRSKDLELGIFLVEAGARVYGFRGARDGLWAVRGLLREFRDKGLWPQPEDGDLEAQYGKLDWLNDKFAELIRELPITMRAEPGVNYSLNYRDESLRSNGMITSAEFEAAAAAGSPPEYDALLTAIQETAGELELLETAVETAYGASALSFVSSKQALQDCENAVRSIRGRAQGAEPGPSKLPSSPEMKLKAVGEVEEHGGRSPDAWREAELIAKAGDVDLALGMMAGLAASEPNGRVRFQRKLLLADLCLHTGRKRLGTSILEELNLLVETHHLETWETSEIIGAVWGRLVKCYRDKTAGTADEDKEAEFFLKLSRLDPWQALACGEPAPRVP